MQAGVLRGFIVEACGEGDRSPEGGHTRPKKTGKEEKERMEQTQRGRAETSKAAG
jgi:hypothetical protein